MEPKNIKATSAYALVEFSDVDYAIQVLNGVQFDGRTLRVCREKTNFGNGGRRTNNMGGGFGSSRWAGDDGGGGGRSQFNKGKQQEKHKETSVSLPNSGDGEQSNNLQSNISDDGVMYGEEAIIEGVKSVISSEIKDGSDEVTSAIACTAAMTLLSSVDAFGLADVEPSASSNEEEKNLANGTTETNTIEVISDGNNVDSSNKMTTNEFQSRCKMPLSELLAEYGEEDLHWQKDPPSSQQNAMQPTHKDQRKQTNNSNNDGMLAQFGKASIHVELVSFGYKYGAPSHSKKGFTYSNPLPPLDVRDLDRAPGHVAKFNGLSYLVKRALLNPSRGNDDEQCHESEDGVNLVQSPMRQRANEIADEIIKVLVESIDEGGHGAISPLTMTVSIGSEYGRHRAVVLVEHLAVVLRARLRRNDGRRFNDTGDAGGNGIVRQPVSVGTRHRDVEARHQDEEAFGEDLKREARIAEKSRRRLKDESGWDESSW